MDFNFQGTAQKYLVLKSPLPEQAFYRKFPDNADASKFLFYF
jgi:hypothetical protein